MIHDQILIKRVINSEYERERHASLSTYTTPCPKKNIHNACRRKNNTKISLTIPYKSNYNSQIIRVSVLNWSLIGQLSNAHSGSLDSAINKQLHYPYSGTILVTWRKSINCTAWKTCNHHVRFVLYFIGYMQTCVEKSFYDRYYLFWQNFKVKPESLSLF